MIDDLEKMREEFLKQEIELEVMVGNPKKARELLEEELIRRQNKERFKKLFNEEDQ